MSFSDWKSRAVSAEDAVRLLYSGMRVFVHGAAATPTPLLDAMVARGDLERMRLYHVHTNGPASFAEPDQVGRFLSMSLFIGAPLRKAVQEGRADFMPIFLSDIPGAVHVEEGAARRGDPDAVAAGSPWELHAWARRSTPPRRRPTRRASSSRTSTSRCRGRTATASCRSTGSPRSSTRNRPLYEHPPSVETEVEARHRRNHRRTWSRTGRRCRSGSARSPKPRWRGCTNKRDLGIHTEMFSDRVVDLVEAGAVTNRYKSVAPGAARDVLRLRDAAPVRLRRRQPARRVPPVRPDERHVHHPEEPEGPRDQLGPARST